ncbi:MAG TPA: hypothetical protein VIH06_10845, partial [Ilumatobacteraceae bacterium]
MKPEDATALIEIIDDDTNPFGDRTQTHTVEDTGGPRWVGLVAGAALVAIVGYGVVTSASSGAPEVAPAPTTTTVPRPTTTVPPTTVPTSSTVAAAPRIGYYAASPPDDFTIEFADAGEVGRAFFPGIYELWATPGSSATEGSWFSIQTEPGAPSSVDAYRVQADNLSVAISHTNAGLSVATFAATEAGSVTITARGWSDDDLVRLAQSIRIGRATMSITNADLTEGYEMISSLAPARIIVGTPVETVQYQSTKDPARTIGLQIAPRNAPNLGGSDVARQTAARFAVYQPTAFEVDGHPALAGAIVGQNDVALASWIAGDHIVTLVGSVTVPELIDLAGTVHEVSANAWFDMQSHTTGSVPGTFDTGPPLHVSLGTDGNGQSWFIDAMLTKFSNQEQIAWRWPNSLGFSAATKPTAQIHSVVEGQRTYVLADLPRAVASGAQLEIDRAGLDPVVAPFNDVSADLDRTLAAYAFSDATQFTAQIVGAD